MMSQPACQLTTEANISSLVARRPYPKDEQRCSISIDSLYKLDDQQTARINESNLHTLFPDGVQFSLTQWPIVDMRADLNTRKFQLLDATTQLFNCEFWCLHGNGAEANESLWELVADRSDMIIETS